MPSLISLDQGRPERLLVIVAHPGDADLAVGGSVARWVSEGSVVRLLCCTSGDASGPDAEADPLELCARREAEQRAAAVVVGYEDVTFMHRPDGALANDLALREQLVRIIRAFRPDAVAAPDPRVLIGEHGFINDVDQRAAGAAALDAVHPAAGNAMAFPHLVRSEGLAAHDVGRLYLFGADQPDTAIDITTALEIKLRAIDVHSSGRYQPERLGMHADAEARRWGQTVGVDAAEAFAVIDRHTN